VPTFIAVPVAGLFVWAMYAAVAGWRIRHHAILRLSEGDARAAAIVEPSVPDQWLGRWLARAGYRQGSSTLFLTITGACVAAGLVLGQLYRVVLAGTLVEMVSTIPGGAGEVLALILTYGHWIVLVVVSLVPTLVVRAVRRQRARAVEQDLPLVLELFATMAEAGLGFDGALTKVVRAQGSERPLISELIAFQFDMLAGIPRSQALRQLAKRVEVPSLTSFTSALVQAEEVGASLAETLRHQADDLRQRRREDALLKAQALPVKLVFPLVICFLPGIFLSTLAPVIYQMIQVAEGVVRTGR
jgi:pilus assembly protein TadC